MFLVNGSVKTEGSDNFLPIDMMYGYKRYCVRALLQPMPIKTNPVIDPDTDKIIGYTRDDTNVAVSDLSPYDNTVTSNSINLSDEDICIFGNTNPDTVPLKDKSSFKFNGLDSYMELACNGTVVLDQQFTISVWINTFMFATQNGGLRTVFILGNSTNNLSLTFSNSSGTVDTTATLMNNGTPILTHPDIVCDGKWHNICVTRDINNVIRLFVDGKSAYTTTLVGSVPTTTEVTATNLIPYGHLPNSSLIIGRSLTKIGHYEGLMDDFYLLNNICEYLHDFDLPLIKYNVPLESEENYSGMVIHGKIAENIKKYDILYYEQANRAYRKADSTNIKKLPARGLALEDGFSGEKIKILTYGTIATNVTELSSKTNDEENELDKFSGEDFEFNSCLPVLTTSNDYNSFTVNASSGSPINLFNTRKETSQIRNDRFYVPGTTVNNNLSWIKIKLNVPKKVSYYSITERNSGTLSQIKSCKLKGSNDKHEWKLLDSQSNLVWAIGETKKFNISHPEEFQYYELYDILLDGSGAIGKIKLYDENFIEVIPDFSGDYCYIYEDSYSSTTERGYNVSDDSDDTYWSPASNGLAGELLFDFGFIYDPINFNHVNVKSFTLTCDNSNNGKGIFVPSNFALYGSDNNVDFEELYHLQFDTPGNSPWSNYGQNVKFTLSEVTHYRYYKLKIAACTRILSGGSPTQFKLVKVELLDEDENNILPIFRNKNRALLGKLNYDGLEVYTPNSYSIQEPYNILNDSKLDRDGWYVYNGAPASSAIALTAGAITNPQRVIIKLDKPRNISKFSFVPRLAWSDLRVNNTQQLSSFAGNALLGANNGSSATSQKGGFYGLYYPVVVSVLAKNEGDPTWTSIDQAHIAATNATQIIYGTTAAPGARQESPVYTCSVTANLKEYEYYTFILQTAATQTNGTVFLQQLRLWDETGTEIFGDVEYNGYWKINRASVAISADDQYNNGVYSARQLLNPQWEFNVSGGIVNNTENRYQYRTNIDKYDPIITITLPNKTHTMYDRRINGYVIASMYNISNPNSYRYPRHWILEGFNGSSWIQLDEVEDFKFEGSNIRIKFDLDQTYDGLESIRLTILEDGSGNLVAPPNYFALKEFYPTFNGQMLEIPAFGDSCTNYKYLNRYSLANKSGETWEIESSSEYRNLTSYVALTSVTNATTVPATNQYGSIDPEYSADMAFTRLDKLSCGTTAAWLTSRMEQSLENHTYDGDKSTIFVEAKSPIRLYAYGMFLTPHAMCGAYQSVKAWKLYGSNDNVTWDELDHVSPLTDDMVKSSFPVKFEVDAQKSYRMFKFEILLPGTLYGIEFYEKDNIKTSDALAISANIPGQLSTVDKINMYDTQESGAHYIQNIGYTGLSFVTAEEEYSVKFFDFNSDVHPANPNQGSVNIMTDTKIGHNLVDGPMVTYLCDSLKINNNCKLTTNVRCRGLRIIVKGNCEIDGTLTMDGMGANYSPFWTEDFPIIDERGRILGYIPRYGAEGGIIYPYNGSDKLTGTRIGTTTALAALQAGNNGNPGQNGTNRATGGGGSGAHTFYTGNTPAVRGGNGARGSCFSGGAGGGSQQEYIQGAAAATVIGVPGSRYRISAAPGIGDGGCGGHSMSFTSSTAINAAGTILGTANSVPTQATDYTTYPYGITNSPAYGTFCFKNAPGAGANTGRNISYGPSAIYNDYLPVTGAGGLLILIVYGNLTINVRGKISSCGSYYSPIAAANRGSAAGGPVSGGGSGGGSINIFYGGRYINNGTITAAGGQRVAITNGIAYGGNGGDGSITVDRLS